MGKVYLIGAGPGNPELITLKGLRAIQESDVILYDRLISEELLDYAKSGAELIFCGKLPNYHAMTQETINRFLVKYAKKGKVVARLKGGDPFIFGRGGEEAEWVSKRGIPYEVVPGVTSGAAAPAYAGIPLTHRSVSASVTFITGHLQDNSEGDWGHLAKGKGTIAIYMGVSKLPSICEKLVRHGRSAETPVAVIYQGTTENQRTVTGTLEGIAERVKQANMKNPSMIVIGEVVSYHESLNWFRAKGAGSEEIEMNGVL
ncbi:uroporphyrinogen-III C-methyltransferase [Guptibacillus hwajinpoensis]|uniref:uroporphyrinogen-III C-methyltransferase n=1 Tax=Guptibacillus hwajinpoensis TaxID=208199 RepID=UPI00373694A7